MVRNNAGIIASFWCFSFGFFSGRLKANGRFIQNVIFVTLFVLILDPPPNWLVSLRDDKPKFGKPAKFGKGREKGSKYLQKCLGWKI